MHPDIQYLPATTKAVANAVICTLVSNKPMGYGQIFIDNHHSSIELAVFFAQGAKCRWPAQYVKTGKAWISS